MANHEGCLVLKGLAKNLPQSEEGVAALGLQVAVRLTADKTNQSIEQTMLDLSVSLDCNLTQLYYYKNHTGLPEFMIDWAIRFFNERGARIGRHQLKPTKAVLSSYGIF